LSTQALREVSLPWHKSLRSTAHKISNADTIFIFTLIDIKKWQAHNGGFLSHFSTVNMKNMCWDDWLKTISFGKNSIIFLPVRIVAQFKYTFHPSTFNEKWWHGKLTMFPLGCILSYLHRQISTFSFELKIYQQ